MYPEFDIKSKYITIHPCDLLPSYLSTIQDRPRPEPKEAVRDPARRKARWREVDNKNTLISSTFSLLLAVAFFHLLCGSPIFISHGPDWLPSYKDFFFEAFASSSWNYVLFSGSLSRRKYLFSLSAAINYIGWKKTKVLTRTLAQENFPPQAPLLACEPLCWLPVSLIFASQELYQCPFRRGT